MAMRVIELLWLEILRKNIRVDIEAYMNIFCDSKLYQHLLQPYYACQNYTCRNWLTLHKRENRLQETCVVICEVSTSNYYCNHKGDIKGTLKEKCIQGGYVWYICSTWEWVLVIILYHSRSSLLILRSTQPLIKACLTFSLSNFSYYEKMSKCDHGCFFLGF